MAHEPHVALCLLLCSSFTHIEVRFSYICLLHLDVKRYFLERGKVGDNDYVSP